MAIFKGNLFNDFYVGTDNSDYITGGGGNDHLEGGGGADHIYGGDGHDLIFDGAGQDFLYGQMGWDVFAMHNAPEADYVHGGQGIDLVHYLTQINTTTVIDLLNSAANAGSAAGDQLVSIEDVEGGFGRESVYGTDTRNNFFASPGGDTYDGRGGFDVYWGGWQPNIQNFRLAFGATAATLAAGAGVSAVPAGAAVAYFEIWTDANNNAIQDAGEVDRFADILSNIEAFVGTVGDDVLEGSDGNEVFAASRGSDKIDGGAGFDTISVESSTGVDTGMLVDLAAGKAERLDGQAGITVEIKNIEAITGSSYGDQLQGSAVSNEIFGGSGDDALDGRGGNDDLSGERGDDIIVGGDGADILSGGEGADVINGGEGIDTLSYASAPSGGSGAGIFVSLLRGVGASPIVNGAVIQNSHSAGDTVIDVENVVGSTFDDVIAGDDNANILEGRMGNDTINGCGGADIIYGERAPSSPIPNYVHEVNFDVNPDIIDILEDCGCAEDDEQHVASKEYDDYLYGGEGDDKIFGQLGNDELCGGGGNDQLYGAQGNDVLEGGYGTDYLEGGIGTDFLFGGAGDDKINGGAGFDIIFGGTGKDSVDYSKSTAGVTVHLGEYYLNSGGDASTDYLTEIMNELAEGRDPTQVMGSALLMSLLQYLGSTGTEGSFTLSIPDVLIEVESVTGSAFADTLVGDQLANTLQGGAGVDTLRGNAGGDTLDGGLGADVMYGDVGNDVYHVDNAGDQIVESAVSGGVDTVVSTISFQLEDILLEHLTLGGTAAINGTGSALANTITGNTAANVLTGLAGNDKLIGGAGNDTLLGGTGADRLNGGTGNDKFVFTDTGSTDIIEDFLTGIDKIDLAAMDANTLIAGDQQFSFIGSNAFSNTAGQLRTYTTNSVNFVAGDVNGDGKADFIINLGTAQVQASDFLL